MTERESFEPDADGTFAPVSACTIANVRRNDAPLVKGYPLSVAERIRPAPSARVSPFA